MSLINEKTIEDVAVWAKENEDRNIFPNIYGEEDSYYTDRNSEETYLMEYAFQNIAELKQSLEAFSGMEADLPILMKLIVEICQNRNRHREIKRNIDTKNLAQEMIENVCNSQLTEKTIKKFQMWAEKNQDSSIFPNISAKEDSYYKNRETEDTYLLEYSFSDITLLQNAMEKYSGLEEEVQILKELTLVICQNKFKSNPEVHEKVLSSEKSEIAPDGKKRLPEFVYVF